MRSIKYGFVGYATSDICVTITQTLVNRVTENRWNLDPITSFLTGRKHCVVSSRIMGIVWVCFVPVRNVTKSQKNWRENHEM